MNRAVGIGFCFLFPLGVACRGAPELDGEPPSAARPAAPMDLVGQASTNWEYLLGKYDSNADGRIDVEEYDRGSQGFERLDLDGDGLLTQADFPAFDSESFRGFYRDQRVLRVIAAHFQADEDTSQLHLDELQWMISIYDEDLDELVDAAEFRAGASEHRQEIDDGDASGTERSMMGDYDPWEVLLEGVDSNGDGVLATEELVAFFHERDDGDGLLDLRGESEEATDTSGVPVGELAPDFSLTTPDGGERIALSDFRGKKPVALIFGSYT